MCGGTRVGERVPPGAPPEKFGVAKQLRVPGVRGTTRRNTRPLRALLRAPTAPAARQLQEPRGRGGDWLRRGGRGSSRPASGDAGEGSRVGREGEGGSGRLMQTKGRIWSVRGTRCLLPPKREPPLASWGAERAGRRRLLRGTGPGPQVGTPHGAPVPRSPGGTSALCRLEGRGTGSPGRSSASASAPRTPAETSGPWLRVWRAPGPSPSSRPLWASPRTAPSSLRPRNPGQVWGSTREGAPLCEGWGGPRSGAPGFPARSADPVLSASPAPRPPRAPAATAALRQRAPCRAAACLRPAGRGGSLVPVPGRGAEKADSGISRLQHVRRRAPRLRTRLRAGGQD